MRSIDDQLEEILGVVDEFSIPVGKALAFYQKMKAIFKPPATEPSITDPAARDAALGQIRNIIGGLEDGHRAKSREIATQIGLDPNNRSDMGHVAHRLTTIPELEHQSGGIWVKKISYSGNGHDHI